MRWSRLGLSSAEQTAVVGLIGVACIGAVTVLGNSVDLGFGTISAGLPEARPIESSVQQAPTPTVEISGGNTATQNQGGNGNVLPSDLGSLDYTANVSSSVETNGANGTTDMLLSKFDIAIRNLLAEGAITEAEAVNLRELSNLGHQLGDIEGILEQQFAVNGNNPNAFKNNEFTYNGRSYSFEKFVAELQLVRNGNGYKPGMSNSVMAQFMGKQKTAVDSLQNERARNILGSLSNEIMAVADATEGAANDSRTGFTTTEFRNLISHYAEGTDPNTGKYPRADKLASTITHNNSAAICTLGNGATDKGKCK